MKFRTIAILLSGGTLTFATSPAAFAEVRSVEREGFVLQITQDVPVPADRAFAMMLRPGDWWDSVHSWSGNSTNMQLEPRVGGCWCEALPHAGGVEHGRIISYNPAGRALVMESLLGPLQTVALSGRMRWHVEQGPMADQSRISWTYQVGLLPSGNPAQNAALAAGVDDVLRQQMARLTARLMQPLPPS